MNVIDYRQKELFDLASVQIVNFIGEETAREKETEKQCAREIERVRQRREPKTE